MNGSNDCLVVGATGMVGAAVTQRLNHLGYEVRALVRGDPQRPRVRALSQAGADIVSGDLCDPASLVRACKGVDTVVCTATAMPHAGGDALQRVDHDGVLALIEAAEQSGVRRFVYTSYSGNIQTDSPLGRAKRACEARLADSPMESVILRPSFFMQVWLGPHLGLDLAQGRARIFGDGAAAVSYVSSDDVAAFAVAAAIREGELRDVIEIGGPDPVSQLQAVALFERLSGRPMQREHVPVSTLEEQWRSTDPLQQTFGALMLACALGDAVPDAQRIAQRYGVSLTSLEEFARRCLQGPSLGT
ncbi:MAG TPA: NmrA family NAD(P)-binding protein [Steroidobacteraceae bacterium]|nr:NmrA family NAD(P)-binding protein [Steroidobacteraceae bacterium]